MPVEVMLLGPPRVLRDGEPVAIDTRKAIALLAALALADRPRPRDTLAELLWPEHDAEHARGALRRTLSTLRGAIGAAHLDAARDQVALVRGPGLDLDLDRFRALVGADELEPAVAVFRGDFLEGFGLRDAPGFEDWQRAEADGLRRELAAALARLAGERPPQAALRHARRWLALDPLHEPAHRALIRLLALSGERAAALDQYRECVRTLNRELGVPPLEETTRLYEAILEGTLPAVAPPSGAAPASSPLAGPATPSPLVGRADDWAALLAAHDGVGADGQVLLLEGEAGIGKTRLAEELVAYARERGAAVLAGRAYEGEATLAYGPLAEALRARLHDDAGWIGAVRPPALAEAARLLPELAPGTVPPPLGDPGAQARFLDGLWTTIAAAAAGTPPGVLVVDDAQWADAATLALLAYGLRRLSGRPLLVVLAWRTPYEHPLRDVVAALARERRGTIRRLERLSLGDVGELLEAVRPDAEAGLGRRLHAETEGLPFLLVEYLSALGDATAASWPLPAGARELLIARLRPAGETARQVLAAAAVLGRAFDVDTVRTVSGRGEEETVRALEELVARGLIREGELDYDFGHEQLRALVYDETSLARRRLLHGRAAEALDGPAAALARHLRAAGRDAEAAHAYAAAAGHARALFANDEALEHLRAALALGHPDRAALNTAIADLLTLGGDYGGALAAYETAAADAPASALALIEQRLGQVHHRRGDWALATAHLEAALAGAQDLAARAGICADLALAASAAGDPARAGTLAQEARALAERAGDPRALGQAHNLLGMLATSAGALDDALTHLDRSLALSETVDDPAGRVAALNNLALAQRSRGELDAAARLTASALELCAALGDRHREAALRNNLADLYHAAGRTDEAMAELKRAVAVFAEVGADDEPAPEVWKLARW